MTVNTYRTTPEPIYIPTRRLRTIESTDSMSTKLPSRYPHRTTLATTTSQGTTLRTSLGPSTLTTTSQEVIERGLKPTMKRAQKRKIRIQPGTIVMKNSEYLKKKYIRRGLATTFHRALLADYFDLSENEMKQMGMTVVAWGFSYQVRDKATGSRNQAQKYFCDFKFRSSTFNAGYVGADINMGITELDG